MDTTIRITAQFYENYAIGPNGPEGAPYWKPKGGHEFIVKVDSDMVMYSDHGDLTAALTAMVAEQSNDYEKFEYINHEVIFGKPTELSTEGLESKLRKQFQSA